MCIMFFVMNVSMIFQAIQSEIFWNCFEKLVRIKHLQRYKLVKSAPCNHDFQPDSSALSFSPEWHFMTSTWKRANRCAETNFASRKLWCYCGINSKWNVNLKKRCKWSQMNVAEASDARECRIFEEKKLVKTSVS